MGGARRGGLLSRQRISHVPTYGETQTLCSEVCSFEWMRHPTCSAREPRSRNPNASLPSAANSPHYQVYRRRETSAMKSGKTDKFGSKGVDSGPQSLFGFGT